MKRLFLFAAVAGLGLVSASPPAKHPGHDRQAEQADGDRPYPPCTRQVRDSCNQLARAHGGRHGGHHNGHLASRHGGHGPVARPAVTARHMAHRIRRAGERG